MNTGKTDLQEDDREQSHLPDHELHHPGANNVIESLSGKFLSVNIDHLGLGRQACPALLLAFTSTQRLVLDCYPSMIQKLLSQAELLGARQTLRAAGKTLVFTNGVFDLLHVGHVRYLAEARSLGDALAVAINSDRTVRELKGEGRPVFNESERAEIIAALRAVDFVTIFDDVSPRSLIAKLLPDVLVKGGDYGTREIHGREEVEGAGGRVLSLPFVDGASTTNILERLSQNKGAIS